MHPFITQSLDKLIIRLVCLRQPKPGRFPPRVAEARKLLQQPDFFGGEIPVPSSLKWLSEHDFSFASPVESPWPETKTVHGKIFRCGEDWVNKPTIVLIHGWNDDLGYITRHISLAKKFLKVGINTAMIELPYHMQRRPQAANAVQDFLSEDIASNMLAAKQAVADIRSLFAWLNAQGCKHIGLWGVSLGGWLTGLTICHEPLARFAVMQIPAARMDQITAVTDFCEPIRHSMKDAKLDISKLNLRSYHPKISRDKILLIEAEDDLFVSKEAIEEIWELWGKPEIWRLRHAHISILMSFSTFRRGVNWVVKKTREVPV